MRVFPRCAQHALKFPSPRIVLVNLCQQSSSWGVLERQQRYLQKWTRQPHLRERQSLQRDVEGGQDMWTRNAKLSEWLDIHR